MANANIFRSRVFRVPTFAVDTVSYQVTSKAFGAFSSWRADHSIAVIFLSRKQSIVLQRSIEIEIKTQKLFM